MNISTETETSRAAVSSTEKAFTIDVQSLETFPFECIAGDEEEARAVAEMLYPDGVIGDVRLGHDSKLCPFCGKHCEDGCDEAQAGGFSDNSLSTDQLQKKYGYWGEHPVFLVEQWRDAICKDDTRASYWHWVWMQVTSEDVKEEGV